MLKLAKWFLVGVVLVVLTACGGGSSDSEIYSIGQQDSGNASTANSEGNTADQGNETGDSTGNPAASDHETNNETYIDNHGDIVPVLSEKPDVLDIDIDNGDELVIRIMRNINLNSEFAKSELSKYSAPTEDFAMNYINVAVDIDVKCEDYGFDQSDLGSSQTFVNGIKFKVYIKHTHYSASCFESDFESIPSYSNFAGKYTIIQSDFLGFGDMGT